VTSKAYYNEIEPYAAEWLRNLILCELIADGDVDTRSIEDVRPVDLAGYTQCHFFAGVGVWSYALRGAGWPDDRPAWTGSCPCQPFSAAGEGRGFDDERHLWPHFHYLIEQCRPPVVIGEQVASKDAEPWVDLVHTDLEAVGYAFGAVPFPAAGVGAPHIRDRLYWVGFAESQWTEKFRARQARTKERWPDKGMGVPLDIQAQLAVRHWPTPRAEDAESSGARLGRGIADTLTAVSRLAGWPTTTTRDYRCPNAKPWAERGGGKKGEQLNNAAAHLLDFGPETPSGSGAATGVGGRLNADFSRWLMGLPAAWQQVAPARSAVTATRSARRKRSNSSAQSSTAGQPDEELWA
jgi:DNA (cytosine-5)-methyltransferase 1